MIKRFKNYMCVGSICLMLGNLGGCLSYQDSISLEQEMKEVQAFLKESGENDDFSKNSRIIALVLDSILENYDKSDPGSRMETKNNMAHLYVLKGNYAKAIEECMEIVALSERNKDEVSKAKANTNLGMVYSILGNPEKALEYFDMALEASSDDDKENAYLKAYVLNNFYYVLVSQGEYDRILEVNNQMQEYIGELSEDYRNEVDIVNNIMLSLYYLHSENQDLFKAEELLNSAKYAIGDGERHSKQFILDFYNKAMGDLLYKQGKLQESIKYYKGLADEEDDKIKSYVKKEAIEQVIELYKQLNQYDDAAAYISKLDSQYEIEAQMVNKDYAEYALYKYEYKNNLKQMANQRLKRYLLTITGVFSALSAAIVLYMKYFRLKKINKLDALTKAYNRRYFEIKYKELMNSDKNFSIIMIDIDNFKKINDTYGHHFGDKILKSTVEKVKEVVTIDESIFRYGGEEFAILLEETDKDKLSKIADDILKNVRTITYDNDKFATISMGIKCSRVTDRDILEEADSNLYKSKTSGKDRFTIS